MRISDWSSDVCSSDLLILQLGDDALCHVGRNGEADPDAASGRREDRRVHADDLAFDVEGRATGVAAVDRRTDLEEIVIGAGADAAAAGRDDPRRDRVAAAERISHADDPVADPAIRRRYPCDEGPILIRLELETRGIDLRIGSDDLRSEEHTAELQS